MPANRAHIPIPEVARLWPHLEHLANSIPPLRDCKVGFLIGHNCIKALTPRDVITPIGDGPYGQRTDLGWGIVGLVKGTQEDADGDDVGTSHHIVVIEVANDLSMPSSSGSAIFSLKNKIKEVLLIECCIEKERLGLKEQLKTTEGTVQDEAGTCKTILSSDIDVVKGEELVESEKAMENVEAMLLQMQMILSLAIAL